MSCSVSARRARKAAPADFNPYRALRPIPFPVAHLRIDAFSPVPGIVLVLEVPELRLNCCTGYCPSDMARQNRHDLVVNVLHITLVPASTMHWGITQRKNDNMTVPGTVLLVVTSLPTYIREFRAHFFCYISQLSEPQYRI